MRCWYKAAAVGTLTGHWQGVFVRTGHLQRAFALGVISGHSTGHPQPVITWLGGLWAAAAAGTGRWVGAAGAGD